MSAISIGGRSRGARAAAECLSLAAAPTFAVMALMTAALGGDEPICPAAHGSLIGGMAAMYGLMGAFHVAPWLRLVSGARS